MKALAAFVLPLFLAVFAACADPAPPPAPTSLPDAAAPIPVRVLENPPSTVVDAGTDADAAPSTWTPLDLPGVVAFVDAREGVETNDAGAVVDVAERKDAGSLANQGLGTNELPPTAWNPTLAKDAFGPGRPGLSFRTDLPEVAAQWLRISDGETMKPILLPRGTSAFWVSKHDSHRAIANHGQNVPLTVLSEGSINTNQQLGFSAGSVAYRFVDTSAAAWREIDFGSGLDDGKAHLVGVVHDPILWEVRAYVDGVPVGNAESAPYPPNAAWATVGSGYRIGGSYEGDDGFVGEVGNFVVANGVFSPDDVAKLYAWERSEGWLP